MNKFVRAAVYIRVSTKRQAEKFGLTYQEREAKTLINKNKWVFTKVYEDRGISGLLGPDKRRGLQYLIEDAHQNTFDKVVVYSIDRLGRSQEVVNEIYNELYQNNVDIVSSTEKTTNKEDIEQLVERSSIELKIMTRRQILGKRERIKLDGECGGPLPYGYLRFEGKVSINQYESHVVNAIYESYYIKKLSMRKIAEILNIEKIKPSKSNTWHVSSISSIINHKEKYYGGSRNKSPVHWPIILTNIYPLRTKRK